jgi:hypothetical protein
MKKLLTLSLLALSMTGVMLAEDQPAPAKTNNQGCSTTMSQDVTPASGLPASKKQNRKEKEDKTRQSSDEKWLLSQMG